MDRGLKYRTALEALFARTGTTAKFGLERTLEFLALLDNPHQKIKTFHVAGTNGKGSVVATLYALLKSKGLRVGRYMSPHLVNFRERIVVDDECISEDYITRFLQRHRDETERLGATFFEITSALAFDYFAFREVDVAVIETGLGGRLDSTNVITPLAAGITSISLDHQEYLGDSESSIAREKAGIFKRGVPAIIGRLSDSARHAVYEVASETKVSALIEADRLYKTSGTHVTERGTHFSIQSGLQRCNVQIGLVGDPQPCNTAVALSMLRAAGHEWAVSLDQAEKILPGVTLPGRFQRSQNFILDVAHNVEGIRSLVSTVRLVGIPTPMHVVVGILGDKDWRGMLRQLAPISRVMTLVNPPSAPPSRAWKVDDAEKFAKTLGVKVVCEPGFERSIRRAMMNDDRTLITGSFHTVGDALRILGENTL